MVGCSFSIFLTAVIWDDMASCSKADKCDYRTAQCQYNDGPKVDCKVRRKGSSTWRELNNRPSFKIKKMKHDGNPYMFAEKWITEKITLNNGVQKSFPEAEVKAYDMFRTLGVKSPLAQLCSVSLYRESILHSTKQDYTMIETINDKAFMNKHFGTNWMLWEGEMGETECKRSSQDDLCDTDQTNLDTLTLDDVDHTEMINYFVGEQLTSHTDSACLGEPMGNNYYVAKWSPPGTSHSRYTYIPSGVDRAFTCLHQYFTRFPQCKPVQQCFQNDNCYARYREVYLHSRDHIYNHIWPCLTPWHTTAASLIGATTLVAPLLLTVCS